MVSEAEILSGIVAALEGGGKPSSDYDLNRDVVLPAGRKLRPAGVLIPIVFAEDQPRVILTKRSSALKHHPGQIAFPGGKQDPGDADIVATALRESREEIGLLPGNVEILGQMACHETVTSFDVTPVVARVLKPFQAIPEMGEVEEVFDVPLAHLLESGNYQVESRYWQGAQRYYYTVPFGPYYIWGATARMLRSLAEAVRLK